MNACHWFTVRTVSFEKVFSCFVIAFSDHLGCLSSAITAFAKLHSFTFVKTLTISNNTVLSVFPVLFGRYTGSIAIKDSSDAFVATRLSSAEFFDSELELF